MTEGSMVPHYSTFGELMYKPLPGFIDTVPILSVSHKFMDG
jgi:hypothetical protein